MTWQVCNQAGTRSTLSLQKRGKNAGNLLHLRMSNGRNAAESGRGFARRDCKQHPQSKWATATPQSAATLAALQVQSGLLHTPALPAAIFWYCQLLHMAAETGLTGPECNWDGWPAGVLTQNALHRWHHSAWAAAMLSSCCALLLFAHCCSWRSPHGVRSWELGMAGGNWHLALLVLAVQLLAQLSCSLTLIVMWHKYLWMA